DCPGGRRLLLRRYGALRRPGRGRRTSEPGPARGLRQLHDPQDDARALGRDDPLQGQVRRRSGQERLPGEPGRAAQPCDRRQGGDAGPVEDAGVQVLCPVGGEQCARAGRGPNRPEAPVGQRRDGQPPDADRPAPLELDREESPGNVRYRRHHGESELDSLRYRQQVQPEWHPAGNAVGDDAGHGAAGDEPDRRDGRGAALQPRRPNGPRAGAGPQPGPVRTISTALLAGSSFFSDPTFWSDFSPARFGPALVPFLAALVCTAIVVLPARWLAFRLGAVAEPGDRRIHREPTALLGGLAMSLGFGLSAALFSTNPSPLGLLLSAAVITTLMVFDDLRGVRPLLKLLFQIGASLRAIV